MAMSGERVEAQEPESATEHIAECLQAAGVRATVRVVRRGDGSEVYVVSGVPRGRRPTVQRIMRDLAVQSR